MFSKSYTNFVAPDYNKCYLIDRLRVALCHCVKTSLDVRNHSYENVSTCRFIFMQIKHIFK